MRWRRTRRTPVLDRITRLSEPMLRALAAHEIDGAVDDMVVEAMHRIPHWLDRWDCERRLFTWLSVCAKNFFTSAVRRERRHHARRVDIEEAGMENMPAREPELDDQSGAHWGLFFSSDLESALCYCRARMSGLSHRDAVRRVANMRGIAPKRAQQICRETVHLLACAAHALA